MRPRTRILSPLCDPHNGLGARRAPRDTANQPTTPPGYRGWSSWLVRMATLSALLAVIGGGIAAASALPQNPLAPVSPQTPAAGAPVNPAQVPAAGAPNTTVCGQAITPPAALPPVDSAPMVWVLELCFDRQGNAPNVETETYLYYIKLKDMVSRPSQGIWVPYDEKVEQAMSADFKALWGTKFLEDLSIEVNDYPFPNGTVGKIVTYRMEERERIKIVTYEGSKQIDRSKIDEQ